MRRSRKLLIPFLLVLTVQLIGPPAQAASEGGKAAGAGRFVGLADLPQASSPAGEENFAPDSRTEFSVADARVASVEIYESPDAGKPKLSMKNPTREGVLLIFGVLERQGDWLKVMLPKRPNGSIGWVKASQVKERKVRNHLQIDVSARKLRAYHGTEMLMEVPIGVGKASSPTPISRSYVDISVPFRNANGAYGAHMLSLAAYSEVLTNFGGGVGQLAIHGTAARDTVGVESSNGCIRLYNEDILKLKELAPTGTPVDILA